MSRENISAAAHFMNMKVGDSLRRSTEIVENQHCLTPISEPIEESSAEKSGQKRRRDERLPLVVRPIVGSSSLENMEKILKWVQDDEVGTIGIIGMGGCGKTTLIKHLYNTILWSENSLIPVWVTVGMDFDIKKLQLRISREVGLDLEYERDEIRRAATLCKFLSSGHRYVLFLDGVWKSYPLHRVGVPSKGACKVIITTRIFSICRKIGCQKTIKIGVLGLEEAWDLFYSVVGHDVMVTDEVRRSAQLACEDCGGLPLAIIVAAKSLTGKPLGISAEYDRLHLKLKLSYNWLNYVKIKQCFLYCVLYPKGFEITREELIRLWIAEGFIDEVPSLQKQYDKGHTIVNILMDHCLLESSEDGHCVKMHHIIWEMAMRITEKESPLRVLSRPNAHIKEFPEAVEIMENLNAISLAGNLISEVPSGISPKFPKLSILILQSNPLKDLPDSFFLHMSSLRVLDLSDTGIKKLPISVCILENLRSLILRCCQKLVHMPSLEKLKALQILDLHQSSIEQFPRGLNMLTTLRYLDLSCCSKLKGLDSGVLSMLPSLRRITCHVGGVLRELQCLRSLEILATFQSICDFNVYVKSLHWQLLNSFHLQVGVDKDEGHHKSKAGWHDSNVVSLHGCFLATGKGECLLLPENLHELYINRCKGLGSLSDIFTSVSGKDLRYSSGSKDVNSENSQHRGCSSGLCDGDKQGGGFLSKLEVCNISRCNDVENIFTKKQFLGLQNLEVVEINDCRELKEFIRDEVGDRFGSDCSNHVIKLHNLKKLELIQLPALTSIYSGLLVCTSLQSIHVVDCPKLTQLPFSFFMDDEHRALLPFLEKIEGQDEWWDSLDLGQPETKFLLQNVFRQKSPRCSAVKF